MQRCSLCSLALLCLFGAAQAALPSYTLTVQPARTEAIYRQGEEIVFHVQLLRGEEAPGPAIVEWTVWENGEKVLATGELHLQEGTAHLSVVALSAGFLLCEVRCVAEKELLTARAGVGVDPQMIRPQENSPADFTQFWQTKKALLAQVPVEAQCTSRSCGPSEIELFDVQVACLGPVSVSGYLARPASAEAGSLPAILLLHGAGVRSARPPVEWAQKGMLALDINAHGVANARPPAYYEALADGALSGYRLQGILSPHTYYYLFMYLRVLRAIDYLAAQPEWDGKTLILYGHSQGGAQAVAGAALDDRVSFVVASMPGRADMLRETSAPLQMLAAQPEIMKRVVNTACYFDTANLAALVQAEVFFTVGFLDTICPPATVYAAYNNVQTAKGIYHGVSADHIRTPEISQVMSRAVELHLIGRQ